MYISEMLFYGEHEHKVDSQGRISLPSRYRDSFRSGIVLSRGPDRCITGYTPSQWESVADRMSRMGINRSKSRRLRRMTFALTYHAETDRQGRAQIPVALKQYAHIQNLGQVVIAGMGNFIEIWDQMAWNQEIEGLEEEAWHIAETSEEQS